MKAQSKNYKLSTILLRAGICLGMLIMGLASFLNGQLMLRLFGLVLLLACLVPDLYENWIKHGKSKRAFILIMVIFSLIPLFVLVLCLKEYLH